MHELPKESTESLRSWRGSIYGSRTGPHPSGLEKGPYSPGDEPIPQSSPILHPTASSRSPASSQRRTQSEQTKLSMPLPQATTGPIPQLKSPKKVSVYHHAARFEDPDPAADRLDDDKTPLSKEQFYELMGMNPPQTQGQPPKELAKQHGVYGKIRGRLRYVQTKYRVFEVATYVFMALQLLLSAVFIVLGSLSSVDSHVAIAVLGAISTVIAGALALMKGQGLPNRLRQVRDDLSNILFEAEELYWDVAAERPVIFADIVKVREDYLRVLQEARRNHPDTWRGSNDVEKALQPQQLKAKPMQNGK